MNATVTKSELESLNEYLESVRSEIPHATIAKGTTLFENEKVQLLSRGKTFYELEVETIDRPLNVSVRIEEDGDGHRFEIKCSCKSREYCSHSIAALLEMKETIAAEGGVLKSSGRQYTREGMIRRVMDERRQKAFSEFYRILFHINPYGEHKLTTARGITYKLTFRDFEKESGYCSCPDYQKNKLGTCKHLIYAFSEAKKNNRLDNHGFEYPFVDVFTDPLNNYTISYFFNGDLTNEESALLNRFFDANHTLKSDLTGFIDFIKEAEEFDRIRIRPTVYNTVEEAYDEKITAKMEQTSSIDLSFLKAELFPYQKEGVEFAAYKKGAIIADEMGLGKTLQAIAIAIVKKQLFGFGRTLIVCPASLKDQWKNEIEKFSGEKATVVDGFPEEREEIYKNDTNYFLIINYETILRDKDVINKDPFDFIILDEAQKIKNYETLTASAVKGLKKRHGLVITGTPIENKLLDLYSIIEFLHPKMLSPIWEFSYRHCFFDEKSKNKITGYTNLQELKERISTVLLRRTKKEVMHQLHSISEITIPVELHPRQAELHASYARGIASILAKKFKTPFDWQRMTMLLQSMRMVCNSTYLIDQETNFSPKLDELKDVLFEKLDLKNNKRKVIIFSEWTKSNFLIGRLLKENDIGFTELNGKVPVKKRQALIREFEQNDDCRVFISTEAGGSGLNLQIADTVINFELPWNPAKKNQRIGRIDRLGQKNQELTVVNFITRNSIEMKIASGLMAKQELFDNVLNSDSNTETVDFSDKGRAQFLHELEMSMQEFTKESAIEAIQEVEQLELFEGEQEIEVGTIQTNPADTGSDSQALERIKKLEELETVMNQGMDFLAGMFKMSTGRELSADGKKIEVDKETGEVVMRFKVEF